MNCQRICKPCSGSAASSRIITASGGIGAARPACGCMGQKCNTTIPDAEWARVEAAAIKFWDKVAAESETKAKVVAIIKRYNDDMVKAGPPYRCG